MGWKTSAFAAIAVLAFAVATSSVDAQQQKRTAQAKTIKKPITRVTVSHRSFLDAGNEYLPGHPRPYNEYIWPPGWVPSTSYDLANTQVPVLYPVTNLHWLPGWQP